MLNNHHFPLLIRYALLAMLALAACQPIQPPAQSAPAAAPAADVAPLLGNLGDHTHPITTNSELAQQYFDEGLILTFGFNHAEAIRSYRDAIKLDPNCAMCYWGIAYALGPNINAVMEPAAVPEAWAALQQALALAPNASEAEQAYIEALATRYSEDPNADRAALDKAYAEAMRELSQTYPDDLDAASLFAEALMDLTPWNYWTKEGEATEYTGEIVSTLEGVLAQNPDHPAANHFYIHAVEASQTPERAVPSADRLTHLVPGAGHLVHMPAHTYWRVGRYHDAVTANEHAIHSDETYIPDYGAQGQFYALAYYPHNIHFLSTAAQMEGNSALAIEAARKVAERISDEAVTAVPPLQDFDTIPFFALVRFGKWEELLNEPQPPADQQYTTGIWHWARGMAYAGTGDLAQAQAEYDAVMALAQSEAMQAFGLPSFSTGATNLELAGHILAAELAAGQGDPDTQISELEAAVAIQDEMAYIEPPAWYYPVRHLLGAALLDAGRAAEAEAVYREDLQQYPKNGWSLFGLTKSLEAQGKTAEAAAAQQEFAAAWANADVELTSSRF
jgi:tetratricopeptide (TPR) repeat protein